MTMSRVGPGWGVHATPNHEVLHVDVPAGGAARITEILAGSRLWVSELRVDEASLEEVFLKLTGTEIEEEVPS